MRIVAKITRRFLRLLRKNGGEGPRTTAREFEGRPGTAPEGCFMPEQECVWKRCGNSRIGRYHAVDCEHLAHRSLKNIVDNLRAIYDHWGLGYRDVQVSETIVQSRDEGIQIGIAVIGMHPAFRLPTMQDKVDQRNCISSGPLMEPLSRTTIFSASPLLCGA